MTISRAQMYRQLYQMGGMGIESLSPMQPAMQPAMQSAMYNPLEENYYSGMPMMMAGGGIANLVNREKYGLGSKIKKFVRNIIPNEVAKVATVAAPFVAPFNPALAAAMAGIGGFDQTGRIGSSLKSAALTYGAGQIARGIGGAGFPTTGQEFLTSLNPFAGYNPQSGFMGLESLFTSPIGTQSGLQLGQYTDAGRSAINQMEPFGGSATTGTLSKTAGTLDQLKTIFDPTSGVDFGTRARAAMDLSGDAIKAMYTNKDGSIDKRMVISTISAIPSYLDAKKKADEVGLTSNEFNEQIYNEEKSRFQNAYQSRLDPASFGIRTAAAGGGMMDDTEGLLSIKLTPAMAEGGRMGYGLGSMVKSIAKAVPNENASGLVFVGDGGEGGGGFGTLIKRLISNNPNMFQKPVREVSENPVTDLYKYYSDNLSDEDYKSLIMEATKSRFGVAMGGRIDYQTGGPTTPPKTLPMDLESLARRLFQTNLDNLSPSEKQYLYEFKEQNKNKKAKGGSMGSEIPVRQNPGGITELDLRAKGGYIPVGIKEKADDVPAMLSKNEFVFTADAVRGAGGGNINKGAQKMYKLMKSLEKKVKKIKVA
jgi:hypothetical protein